MNAEFALIYSVLFLQWTLFCKWAFLDADGSGHNAPVCCASLKMQVIILTNSCSLYIESCPLLKYGRKKIGGRERCYQDRTNPFPKETKAGRHLHHSRSVDWARCLFRLESSWAIRHLCPGKNPPSAFQLALCFSPFSWQMAVVEFVTKSHILW